jgi:hypothetical protein
MMRNDQMKTTNLAALGGEDLRPGDEGEPAAGRLR